MDFLEYKWFTAQERQLPDAIALPWQYLVKCLLFKVWRRLRPAGGGRLVWTVTAVSDASGPTANVRNYLEHQTIRQIIRGFAPEGNLARACEIGCGYGRITMVLKEFAKFVKGFEREEHLVEIARALLPDLEFQRVEALTDIGVEAPYDLVMSCTVLQHLADREARQVCGIMKNLAPQGHILLIEKTEAFSVTNNLEDGTKFISRARSVDIYREYLEPFNLVAVRDRAVEPGYDNPLPGKCMLFVSPSYQEN